VAGKVRGTASYPPGATRWLPRGTYQIGMLYAGGAVGALTAHGLARGGRRQTLKDYLHFNWTNL
jgi:hypothetical protein